MMMRSWALAATVGLGMLTLSCGGGDDNEPIRGSGALQTEEREVGAFDRIDLQGEGRLIIDPSQPARLEVRTDDNLLALIETEVTDRVLVISTKRDTSIDPSSGVTYAVRCDALSGVRLSGSGDIDVADCLAVGLTIDLAGSGNIRIDGVDSMNVDGVIAGSGSVELTGRADGQRVTISGSGTYDAGKLETQTADVDIPGSGFVVVWATDALDARISGSGSVSYTGDPVVTQTVTGSGTVTRDGGG